MQERTATKYSNEELDDYSADQLLRLLKEAWGYSETQSFYVIGSIKNTGTFFVLEKLRSINDGKHLLYPLKNKEFVLNNIYIGRIYISQFEDKLDEPLDGRWIKAQVELSPEFERNKHGNPFELQTINNSLRILKELPEGINNNNFAIDGMNYIEQWVYDFYREKHHKGINTEREQKEKLVEKLQDEARKLEEKEVTKNKLREDAELEFAQRMNDKEKLLRNSEKLEIAKRKLRKKAKIKFAQLKQELEVKLNELKQLFDDKANILLELDLISQDNYNKMCGQVANSSQRQGHDFAKIFSSDVKQAVSYIQAFMYNKHIVYRKKILEDFFALLTTHDLIILAGDSGSGKTHLVKSFADAIGGKAIIIPVKPNWTSAEDLLGYYNPLEQRFLSTQFLEALFEAQDNPEIPYFICLDEMNLARVEYYFADFLSSMEERNEAPKITLYSDTEGTHLAHEVKNFISLIDETKTKLKKPDITGFLDILRDENLNTKLHELCGFREGDSLLKYHTYLRKLLSCYVNTRSFINLPPNVRIIGTINVDETTHYLSPKILDRAHVLRFGNPLLADWEQIEKEIEKFDLDLSLPIKLNAIELGERTNYPAFNRKIPLVDTLVHLVREYIDPIGIEFGLRTIRQACLYSDALEQFGAHEYLILNNIVLHKILPKLMFSGEKIIIDDFNNKITRLDKLHSMRDYLDGLLEDNIDDSDYCVNELDRVISNAKANDGLVNYWSR